MGRKALLEAFAQGNLDMRGWRIRNCPDITGSFEIRVKAGGSNYFRVDQCHGSGINIAGRLDQFSDVMRGQLEAMALGGQRQLSWMCWYVQGTGWTDPANPPQNRDPNEGDPLFPCPKPPIGEPGYKWFPESAQCECVLLYRNFGWDYSHTVIPFHPVYPPTDYSGATLSARHQANLKTFLGWLNEFGFETLIVRPVGQGSALEATWEAVPSNDNFANGIDLSGAPLVPPLGTMRTLGVDANGVILTLVNTGREAGEPDGGLAWSAWYRVNGDGQVWSIAVSRPQRFLLEAFHANNPATPAVNDLVRDAVSDGVSPMVFTAATTHPYYYIRVSVSDYNNPESFPDYYTLNYARGVPNIPVPAYPTLPFPIPEGWQENQFVENSAFTRNVAALVEANKGALNVVYDLGVEHANPRMVYSRLHRHYCARLWADWVAQFGVETSCGFSALQAGFGIGYMIDLFKQSGFPLPSSYAFDSYGNEYEGLKRIHDRLKAEGSQEVVKPVRIFETYYNDSAVHRDIRKAMDETGINFQGVMQWTRLRGGPVAGHDPFFEDGYPSQFSNYIFL